MIMLLFLLTYVVNHMYLHYDLLLINNIFIIFFAKTIIINYFLLRFPSHTKNVMMCPCYSQ